MFRRRGIVLLLVLCFVMSLLPVGAFAQDTAEETIEEVYLNPLYDAQTELQRLKQLTEATGRRGVKMAAQSGQVYTTLADAAQSIRAQLEERSTSVSVSVQVPAEDEALASKLFDMAVEHTGVPTQGDYLGWEVGGWSMKGSKSHTSTGYTYKMTYTVDHYTTAEQEQTVDTLVAQALAEMALPGKSREDKIHTIYDYVCDHVTYDNDHLEDETYTLQFTAYAAIANGTAVCQGYSVLLYRLMLESGIDCRVIVGKGNGGDHAWNIVKLGGVYYCMDSTWDSARTVHRYELCGLNDFVNHTRGEDYTTAAFTAAFPTSEVSYVSGTAKDFDDLTYLVAEGSAVITECDRAYTGSRGLPEQMDGCPVTTIGFGAFDGCAGITSVTIPASVTAVSDYAFSGCGALTDVVFLGTQDQWNAVSIGSHNEPLTAAALHLEPVMDYVDAGTCGVDTTWVLDETGTVTITGTGAIDAKAFAGRRDMVYFVLADNVTDYTAQNGILYDTLGTLIAYPAGRTGEDTLPDFVTSIGNRAFSGCSLTGITLSEQAGFLAENAFENSASLKTVRFAGPLVVIGRNAFTGCNQLEQVIFEDYPIPEGGSWEGGVIEANAFAGCASLKSIDIPDYVTRITGNAFSDCTALERVSLPAALTILPEYSFLNCSQLTEIQIPSNVQLIEDGAFGNCSALSSVTLSSGVTRIRSGAFYGCDSLETVVFDGTPAEWNAITIDEGNDALRSAQIQFLKEDEQPLSITAQPQPFYGEPFSTAKFTVSAEGKGLTYQWFCSDDGASWEPSDDTGCTTDTLQTTIYSGLSGRLFKCVITDAKGSTIETDPVSYYMDAQLNQEYMVSGTYRFVPAQSGSYTFYCRGTDVTLTVTHSGAALTPTDVRSNSEGGFDSLCKDFTLTAGEEYWFTADGVNGGGCSVSPDEPPVITAQPVRCVVYEGDTVTFSVAATGSQLAYEWEWTFDGGENWNPIEMGVDTALSTLTFKAERWMSNTQYRCKITDRTYHTVYSDPARLLLNLELERSFFLSGTYRFVPEETTGYTFFGQGNDVTLTVLHNGAEVMPIGARSDSAGGFDFLSKDYELTAGEEYLFVSDGVNGGGCGVYLNVLPTVVTQPKDCVVYEGEQAEFTIEATGNSLSLEWERSDDGGATWNAYELGDTVRLAAQLGDDGTQFRCIITDRAWHIVYSDAVTLTVLDNTPIRIVTAPENFYGDPGSPAEFTVAAVGEGLTYQWYFSPDGVSWAKSGSTGWNTDTLQPVLRANNSGRQFKCVITDAAGNVVETEPVVMALLSSEVTIVSQPEDFMGETNVNAVFHVEAEGENLTYLWYYRDSEDAAWTQSWGTGYNTDTLTTALRAYRDGRQFRCEIKSGGENVVYTEPVTMSLTKTEVEVLSQPEDMTARAMTLVQFHVDAEGENLTYRWYVKQGADAEWEPSFNDGYYTDTLNVRLYEYRDGYQYKCEILSGGQNRVETEAVTLRMIPKTAAITAQPESVCTEPSQTVTFHVGATGEALTYQWQFRKTVEDAWVNTGMTGNQTDTLTVVAIVGRNGYQFRCAVTDSSGVVTYTVPVDLKIGTLPKIVTQPQSYVGAPGTTAVFSVEAEGEGLTYQWYYKDASGHWSPSGAADAQSAVFSVAALSYRDGYQYRCAVTNAEGLTVYTDAAMLSIIK